MRCLWLATWTPILLYAPHIDTVTFHLQESLMQGDSGAQERRAQLKATYETSEKALHIIGEATLLWSAQRLQITGDVNCLSKVKVLIHRDASCTVALYISAMSPSCDAETWWRHLYNRIAHHEGRDARVTSAGPQLTLCVNSLHGEHYAYPQKDAPNHAWFARN